MTIKWYVCTTTRHFNNVKNRERFTIGGLYKINEVVDQMEGISYQISDESGMPIHDHGSSDDWGDHVIQNFEPSHKQFNDALDNLLEE